MAAEGQPMSESLTLELPAEIARRARDLAAATNRRVEDVVVGWIERVAADPPVEEIPDAEVLELSRMRMSDDEQDSLSDFLRRQAELAATEPTQLEGLLGKYRRGLVLKARATKVAVSRGLISRLNDNAVAASMASVEA
jgi:hypothetical protein